MSYALIAGAYVLVVASHLVYLAVGFVMGKNWLDKRLSQGQTKPVSKPEPTVQTGV